MDPYVILAWNWSQQKDVQLFFLPWAPGICTPITPTV